MRVAVARVLEYWLELTMGLLRSALWFALFLASTFVFTVLFEHGPANFVDHAKEEVDTLKKLYGAKVDRNKEASDKIGR